MSDLISRQAAIDASRKETVSTNPDDFDAHEKFIPFMNDREISSFGKWQWANGFNTALVQMEINIGQLPSAQPERKTGMSRYIDADAAVDAVKRSEALVRAFGFHNAIEAIREVPAADVAPVRHGKWTIGERTNAYGGREIICSECGESFMVSPKTLEFLSDTERYCCRCGATMDGGE